MSAPRYDHDCDECKFVGTLGPYDLYVHVSPYYGAAPSVLARHGSLGPDYLSGTRLSLVADDEGHIGII